jgi:hypothetical protein
MRDMRFAGILLLTLLSQTPDQPPLSSAAIRAAGHTYHLFCLREGEEIQASETGLCQKTDSGGVTHFEIRDEDGEAKFAQDAPAGKPLSYVAMVSIANAGKTLLDMDTSSDERPGGGPKSAHVNYYFDLSASGLVAFSPGVLGVDGFAKLDTGTALSRTFDTGFFQFSVLLGFNQLTHRIEIQPDQTVFSALSPPGRDKAGPSGAVGEVKLYASHDTASAETDLRIERGHVVAWWQSLNPVEKPAAGQVVTILAAWAPVSLRRADNAAEGVQMVYFDWNNLWLKIQVDERTGWIKGTSSFRAIGLTMGSAPR